MQTRWPFKLTASNASPLPQAMRSLCSGYKGVCVDYSDAPARRKLNGAKKRGRGVPRSMMGEKKMLVQITRDESR